MTDLTDVQVEEIFFNRHVGSQGDIGMITLNRPKALNALSQTMCIAIHQALQDWQQDPAIKAVVIRGEGDKAFCAGGDIRQLYDNGADKVEESSSFFWHEYRMNDAIKHFTKPYIAILDGITMGGGCGLSMHGSFRVATERLMLAMPETGIGFFPDVGGGHFLARCPDHSGVYLGLTGNRIDAADALYTGFATHGIHSSKIDDMLYQLQHCEWGENLHESVDYVLSNWQSNMGDSQLAAMRDTVSKVFGCSSVADIVTALQECDQDSCQPWCAKVLKTLQQKSPTSVLVTFEQLRRAQSMSFSDALKMEFNMAWHFMQGHDFYEGVRAALVDKDRNPQWSPEHIEQVLVGDVDAYFEDVPVKLDL